jgi:hypothetical protein
VSGLANFLRARLDEDESAARIISAGGYEGQIWRTDPPGQVNASPLASGWAINAALGLDPEHCNHWVPVVAYEYEIGESRETAERYDSGPVALVNDGRREVHHIIRHDPDRVLRDVEAKRGILAEYESPGLGLSDGLRVAVELLAGAWSDHPDYQAEGW